MKVKQELKVTITIFFLMAVGCSSYHVKPDIAAQERFKLARLMFKNRDYFDAKSQFKIITLNNPGASFVDEAQYFLGECHFHLKEYVIASDEFNRLVRLYPKSQWVDDAQFKSAYCDYKLSPKPSLDQTYTVKAVENFQRFIEDFPNSDLIPQAEALLKICRTKLSEKEFKAGELYRKMGDCVGAYVYFSSVADNYYDTRFAERAIYWKAECLFKMRRNQEARTSFEELLRRYPRSEFTPKAKERLERIDGLLVKAREANGVSPLGSQTKN
ncbi:MAG: outer membrane protein assembly factor BamD [bacterium]